MSEARKAKTTSPRLRWRKAGGSKSSFNVHQDYELMHGREIVARAAAKIGDQRTVVGYYWYARGESLGIKFRNTSSAPVPTMDEAKAQAMEYVKECLKRKGEVDGQRNTERIH